MKVFLTGATGYVGSVVAEKLQKAGHQVIGLARSDTAAATLESKGIAIVRGDLDSAASFVVAAHAADGVIHTAFKLDGGNFAAGVSTDVNVVRALLGSVEGTDKPLVITSGTAILGDTGDIVFDEETPITSQAPSDLTATGDQGMGALLQRIEIEHDVLSANSVRGIILRPPNVYGRSDERSLLNTLRMAGQSLGAVPYAVGTADHKWSYVHVDDLADLYILALKQAKAGELFHAGAEVGLKTKAIAQALSRGIGLGGKTVELAIPELGKVLGFPSVADYWARNSQSSGEKARRLLGWKPQHVQMLTEIATP